jgi:hypothetical protein
LLGLSCRYNRFLSSLGCPVGPVQNIYFLTESPYTTSIPLFPLPTKLGRKPCLAACHLVCGMCFCFPLMGWQVYGLCTVESLLHVDHGVHCVQWTSAPWINHIDDNAFLKHLLASLEQKTQDVFYRYYLQFCASPSCPLRNVYGACISTLQGGWVFVHITILQSCVMNWG